jgi:phospholipase C
VQPPKACAPDDIAPKVPAGAMQYDFASYGFRVPLVVVSPWAKPHYVSHMTADHTSILKFIEVRYHLNALSRRDANAYPLTDMFDFSKATLATPPSLPEAPIDQAKLAECMAKFPLKPDMAGQAPLPDMATTD